jgi:NAD(P)H-nitrite reductase large subunit
MLERFTKNGLRFEDGSELKADIVVMATGYVNAQIRRDRCSSDKCDTKMG